MAKFNRNQWRSFRDTSIDELIPTLRNADHILNSNTVDSEHEETVSSDCYQFSTDYSSSDSDGKSVNEDSSLLYLLKEWYIASKPPREHMRELLAVLRKFHPELPADPRTLAQNPRSVNVTSLCGGQYFYFGLANVIRDNLPDTREIDLQLSVDGIPLYKSSSQQFWPISISINGNQPCFVALFYGSQKPTSLFEYTKDFIEEFKGLDGKLTHNGQTYSVKITAVVADAPARAFLKNIVGHNAYNSCERCEVVGERVDNTTVFLDCVSDKRTDVAFDEMLYEDTHQNGPSPFSRVLGCVTGFPLDYMHLLCLGTVRRMITFWRKETLSPAKLSPAFLRTISSRLKDLSGQFPSDFARQPRALTEVDRWKAVEFRQFLLYTGAVVLRGILTVDHYNHFCTLMVASSILLDEDGAFRKRHMNYARQLLLYFVQKTPKLYGKRFVTYNIHALIHLADDCENYQLPLHSISAFPFENLLGQLKRLVRNANNPIAQVVKQLAVRSLTTKKDLNLTKKLGKLAKDKYVRLKCGRVAIIDERDHTNFTCRIVPERFTESLFTSPLESSELGINTISSCNLNKVAKCPSTVIQLSEMTRKVVALQYEAENMTVFIPLKSEGV